MNTDRLVDAIDMMEKIVKAEKKNTLEVKFNMGTWYCKNASCGTAACFAGHLAMRHPEMFHLEACEKPDGSTHYNIQLIKDKARTPLYAMQEYFHVNVLVARFLIAGEWGEDLDKITAEEQLRRVRNLLRMGQERFIDHYHLAR